MIPKWLSGVRNRVPAQIAIVLGLVPVAALLALWWYATRGAAEERAISPTILPSPLEVARSFPDLVRRDLFHHALVSFERIGVGYVCAVSVVVPLGILMGAFGIARSIFSPAATASGYIPIATLVPLTLSWFGTDELQKVVFLSMAFGIYLLPLVVKAIESVPDVYIKTSLTLGASSRQIVTRVLVPIALPDIWHSMRLAFGVGWTYLVLTEVVVMESGLGYLVQMSFRRGPREHIYLVILVITAIAWVADLAWRKTGSLLFRNREGTL